MRYDDWDVILFPKDSHTPIQEFRTACYGSRHINDTTPVLASYIISLPPATPFRVSVHSWSTVRHPSANIESLRTEKQKVMYMLQIIVDGVRVYHGLYDISCRWPQEIGHVQPTLAVSQNPASSHMKHLEFPSSSQGSALIPESEFHDKDGLINVVLSEQLVQKAPPVLGETVGIACFSFIHASREVLEQTGISWPTRNPFHTLQSSHDFSTPTVSNPRTLSGFNPTAAQRKDHLQPLSSLRSQTVLPDLSAIDPFSRPGSHPSMLSQLRTQPYASNMDHPSRTSNHLSGTRRRRHQNNMSIALTDFETQGSRDPFVNADELVELGHVSGSSRARQQQSEGMKNKTPQEAKKGSQQILVTLRDDQLDQFIEAMSPLTHQQSANDETAALYELRDSGCRQTAAPTTTSRVTSSHTGQIPGKSSQNYGFRSTSNDDRYRFPQVDKENRAPSRPHLPKFNPSVSRATRSSSCIPAPVLRETTNGLEDFMVPHQQLYHTTRNHGVDPRHSKVHISDGLQAFKVLESTTGDTTNLEMSTRNTTRPCFDSAPHAPLKPLQSNVEIIDVDAISSDIRNSPRGDLAKLSPYKPTHKPGTSSMDSTGRIERQLFSALGEELGGFGDRATGSAVPYVFPQPPACLMSPLQAQEQQPSIIAPNLVEKNGKRKARDILSSEQDLEPSSKKEKSGQNEVEQGRAIQKTGEN